MHLDKIAPYSVKLGLFPKKPTRSDGPFLSQFVTPTFTNNREERCRLVMSCVLLKQVDYPTVENAHALYSLPKTEFKDKKKAHFLDTFSKDSLNLKNLSDEAQSWYATHLLCNTVNEACLEDMTVITLQHILQTTTDHKEWEAAYLGLDIMQDHCIIRWFEEKDKCAITLTLNTKLLNTPSLKDYLNKVKTLNSK